jgi:polar amino acid transport system substrate-binding protein
MTHRSTLPMVRCLVLATGALAALAISALGLVPAGQAAGPRAHSAAIAVPPAIKARGYLTIATNPPYYPMEDYVAAGSSQCCRGLDVDLGNAIAARLGLKARWLAINDFGALIAGVNSGNYDLVMSSVTITPERSKHMHFVKYLVVGEGIAVAAGNPHRISGIPSLSGLDVALQSGTTEGDDVKAANKVLAAQHKKLITAHTFTSDADSVQAIFTGQVAAYLADFPIVANAVVKSRGRLQLSGPQFNAAPYGIAVPLKQTELYAAVQQALAALEKDGTYLKLVRTYGLQGASVLK